MNEFDENYTYVLHDLPEGFQLITEGFLRGDDLLWVGSVRCWLFTEIHFPNALGVDIRVFTKVARKFTVN